MCTCSCTYTCCSKSKLSAYHHCIRCAPGVVTHCSPYSVVTHLHTALVGIGTANQPEISRSAGCEMKYRAHIHHSIDHCTLHILQLYRISYDHFRFPCVSHCISSVLPMFLSWTFTTALKEEDYLSTTWHFFSWTRQITFFFNYAGVNLEAPETVLEPFHIQPLLLSFFL